MTLETLNEQDQQSLAQAQLKAAYEDGIAEINGRQYEFSKTNHSRRVQVFAYFTSIQNGLANGDMSFLATKEFKAIWDSIEKIIMLDGVQLSAMPQHWETYPEDYIMLVTTALGVISYPFLKGINTN